MIYSTEEFKEHLLLFNLVYINSTTKIRVHSGSDSGSESTTSVHNIVHYTEDREQLWTQVKSSGRLVKVRVSCVWSGLNL